MSTELINGIEPQNGVLRLPPSYDRSTPLPLIVYLHGGTENMTAARRSGIFPAARERGWLAVSPEGADIGFVAALLAEPEDPLVIDSSRVYASGFSNGGMLAHGLASEMSDTFAAIAPSGGTIGGANPSTSPTVTNAPPPRPVPILLMHEMQDTTVKFRGGVSNHADRFDISFADSVAFWADVNGRDPDPDLTDDSRGTHATFRNRADHGEVVANTYTKLGHSFPSVKAGTGVDEAVQVMDFFARQQLP